MKKRTIKLAFLSLMMTAVLFNCKDDKKTTDPETPDTAVLEDLDKVTMADVAVAEPAAVESTDGSVEVSAAAAAVSNDLAGLSSGTVSDGLKDAGTAVSGALSTDETSVLTSLSSTTISDVAAGGAVPANLQAVLDKAMANPALSAYLPKITFPTVAGVTLRGKRIAVSNSVTASAKVGVTTGTEQVEKVDVSDACVAAGQAAFDTKKAQLDASKASQDAAVAAKYVTWTATVASNLTSCNTAATDKVTPLRAQAQAAYAAADANIESGKAALGDQLYTLLKALNSLALIGNLSSLNTLLAAETQACTAKQTAATTNANAARDKALADINTAYTTALASATTLKNNAIQSCHNQGSGN